MDWAIKKKKSSLFDTKLKSDVSLSEEGGGFVNLA